MPHLQPRIHAPWQGCLVCPRWRKPRSPLKLHADFGTPDFDAEYQAALASSPRKPGRHTKARSHGLSSGIERRQRGRISLRRRDVRARISSCMSSTPPVINHSPRLRRRPSLPAATVALRRRPKLAIFSTLCAGYFVGQLRPGWSKLIRPLELTTHRGRRPQAFDHGPRKTLQPMSGAWPIGTRQRVWLDVLLYTGLRRGDAVRLGRPACSRTAFATIKTEKSGDRSHPADPAGSIQDTGGRTMRRSDIHCRREWPSADERVVRQSFSQGMPYGGRCSGFCTRHCVRLRRPRAANAGATVAQLEAIFGWRAARWLRSTPAPQIGAASREAQCTRLRTSR